ncbi:MAG TPA: 30S ribosomal protein S8e [Methanomassiliicoccales archaeon]|nr:30S ribosomal protein S8e [Methanomassiliicoccales archaeon]
MALWQGKSRRKATGGMRRPQRKKRRFEIGREIQFTFVGAERHKMYRTKGGNSKVRMLRAEFANVVDPKDNTMKRVKILTVKENPANPNYVQRNIINKGAKIQTDAGMARVTSRPGQDGTVNAMLIE